MKHISIATPSSDYGEEAILLRMRDPYLRCVPYGEGDFTFFAFRVLYWVTKGRLVSGGLQYCESMSYWHFVNKEDL